MGLEFLFEVKDGGMGGLKQGEGSKRAAKPRDRDEQNGVVRLAP